MRAEGFESPNEKTGETGALKYPTGRGSVSRSNGSLLFIFPGNAFTIAIH